MKVLIDQIMYNQWANLRLLDRSAELDPKSFKINMDSSFPSVQKTWIHIIWAEELWLNRWQGLSFVSGLNPQDYPNIESIKEKLEELSVKHIQFLKNLESGDEDKNIGYENFQGEKWIYSLRQMVQHMTIHSAYHRGQLVTLLRQLGVKPPCTDYLIYIDDK